jgi:hypothetical protein
MINSCGYAVLFLSEYRPTAWFGGLLALTMAVAFLAEIFILPPIIKLLPRVFGAQALRRGPAVAAAVVVLAAAGLAPAAAAQTIERPTGNVSVFGDWLPSRETRELRARVFVEEKLAPADRVRFTFSGFLEGPADRAASGTAGADPRAETTGIARVHEAVTELRIGRFDMYAGYGRVVWGRLDELQPTDVINPLDVSRFLFEGRSEARLPVAVVRGRVYFTPDVSLEGVYVPVFRRGRFDQLNERTSPFNIAPELGVVGCLAIGCPAGPPAIEELEPSARWNDAQGGARFSATSGRLDWSLSAYRGFEALPLVALEPARFALVSQHPRFTMIGGDFESVAGTWGFRGEAAAFVHDNFQGSNLAIVSGSSFDAGFGVDRRAGEYQLSGTVLFHREAPDDVPGSDLEGRSDVSLIVSGDRTFARERYRLRAFSVYNPSEGSAFLRAIAMAKLTDDVALEASGGWFPGEGSDLIGRFSDSDFLYARLRYYF